MELVTHDLEAGTLGQDELQALVQAYNRQLAHLPSCFPITCDEFTFGLSRDWRAHPLGDSLIARLLTVAHHDGAVTAFAETGLATYRSEGRRIGLVRFFTYEPGRRLDGAAVLDASEQHLVEQGAEKLQVFTPQDYSYRFHTFGFGMLSHRQGHILGLLRNRGYASSCTAELLSCSSLPLHASDKPESGADVHVQAKEPTRGDKPNLHVEVYLRGQEIASCYIQSAREFVASEQAGGICYTPSLRVSPDEQGKGWGRFVLGRANLEASHVGFDRNYLVTGFDNRAILLYTNHGYEVLSTLSAYWKQSIRPELE